MEHPVILFDGVCNFCDASINFVMKRDKARLFRFAPLQSSAGATLGKTYGFDPGKLESFILIENGHAYRKSTAALRVLRRLPFPWQLLYVFIIIPPFIRDRVYGWIAANRYRWFGKKDACMIPTPDMRSRFLD